MLLRKSGRENTFAGQHYFFSFKNMYFILVLFYSNFFLIEASLIYTFY